MLKIDYSDSNKTLTCILGGRLDTLASAQLDDDIFGTLYGIKGSHDDTQIFEGHIVFDMQAAEFIASSFIRICVKAAKQVPKGHFTITRCDPMLKKTFKIAGLDEVLSVT